MSSIIYLDNNATTPIDPVIFAEMEPWFKIYYGNPSSIHRLGKQANLAIHQAREKVASLLKVQPSELIFTSGGTESIHTAIFTALSIDPDKKHIITSSVEHSATLKICEYLATRGYQITYLRVDSMGLFDTQQLEESITNETALVSLLLANNETGVLFPIDKISAITQMHGIPLHIDAVQAVGKIDISLQELPIQYLSLSGHKFNAPKGIGALYINRSARFTPLFRGNQEETRRAGTQNVPAIVGLGKASELAQNSILYYSSFILDLRSYFEEKILAKIPYTHINGHKELRLPNTTNITFSNVEAQTLLLLMDEKGICCSGGSACSSGSIQPSHVLSAMGLSREKCFSSLRFSLGKQTNKEDINHVLDVLPLLIEKIRSLR